MSADGERHPFSVTVDVEVRAFDLVKAEDERAAGDLVRDRLSVSLAGVDITPHVEVTDVRTVAL